MITTSSPLTSINEQQEPQPYLQDAEIAAMERQHADERFNLDTRIAFKTIIIPAVSGRIQQHKFNGLMANMGQDLHTFFYDKKRSQVSASFHFKKNVMQVDIYPSAVGHLIDCTFRFKTGNSLNNVTSLEISAVTVQKITSLIKVNTEMMRLN